MLHRNSVLELQLVEGAKQSGTIHFHRILGLYILEIYLSNTVRSLLSQVHSYYPSPCSYYCRKRDYVSPKGSQPGPEHMVSFQLPIVIKG